MFVSSFFVQVALEYSGVKAGRCGAVLAMELSEVDQGAVLNEFSQYPGYQNVEQIQRSSSWQRWQLPWRRIAKKASCEIIKKLA